jgi:hypothetical protein
MVSSIGFGCASLGSRIAPSAGLRSIERAFDLGVNWFDVAPAYGGGTAESILGPFVRLNRQRVFLCSKMGRIAPARHPLIRLAAQIARPVLARSQQLRTSLRRSGATSNRSVPLDAGKIASSIESSLRKLQTDYLDVFALHVPVPEDLLRDDVLRCLEEILLQGKARFIGVAGSYDAAQSAMAASPMYRILQVADNPWTGSLTNFEVDELRHFWVSHSILGISGALDSAKSIVEKNAECRELMIESGYTCDRNGIATLLLDRALAVNRRGVVLSSMFAERHLLHNVKRASLPVNNAAVKLVQLIHSHAS